MARHPRDITVFGCTALVLTALSCSSSAAAAIAPLPSSDYTARAACAPAAPGHAGCMALALVPLTAAAREHTHPLGIVRAGPASAPSPAAGSFGLRPQDVHSAYSLPTSAPAAQTVAIVDAFNDPTAASDLQAYSEEFGLPACTTGNGCLTQVNENGASSPLPFPQTIGELEAGLAGSGAERSEAEQAAGWGLEISLDMEAVHATCESCHIVIVEARSSSYADLEAAERTAAGSGASGVSNSWGGPEEGEDPAAESASPFNHAGLVITASAGDSGYLGWDAENSFERGYAEFPASSPHVVAVGGTRLSLGVGGAWAGETVWNGSGAGGGGCSVEFDAQPWQQALADWSAVGCGNKRAVADVSADADPYTGLAVHDSSPACSTRYFESKVEHVVSWCTIGGTSLASPLIASVFALAGGAAAGHYAAQTLYENALAKPGSLHDVTSGSNGECAQPFQEETGLSACSAGEEAAASCASQRICLAGEGYDGPSGLGTPDGVSAFDAGAPQGNGGSPGEGGGSGGGTGGGAGGGAGEGSGASSAGAGGSSQGGSGAGSHSSTPVSPPAPARAGAASGGAQLSALGLTVRALAALNRVHPRTSAVAFAFTSSAPESVRATLSRRARRHRHAIWQALPGSSTIAAAPGRNSARLGGSRLLGHGVYRLTLTPASGSARSLEFQIG
ncbi:MAG TPA: hypothetical protein VKG82_02510 [Solirubrobacteraceae bacterium]|nr:hypothetical protein [Solirubrobacteraceae bacterium]